MHRGITAAGRLGAALCAMWALLALAACATGGATDRNSTDTAATIRLLTAQADAWDRAIVAKQPDAIAANVAPDFAQIDSTGQVHARDAFIADLLDPGLRIDPYTVEDFSVRVYGNTALLTGRIRMSGVSDGAPFKTHFRYIDVYVQRDGRWKVVSIQTTRIKD